MEHSHYSKVPKAEWRWKNFSPAEMACKGTGRLKLDEDAMDKLQALRDLMGVPFSVTSAYRSPEHNKKVGGAPKSKHMEGIAFDISMKNMYPSQFIAAAKKVGFTSFGTYPKSNFIHIDTREVPATWGEPFPAKANRFSEEVPPKEVVEPKKNDRLVAAGAAGGASLPVIYDAVKTGGATVKQLQSDLSGMPEWVQLGSALAVGAIIGFLLWRQFRSPKG